MNLGLAGRRAIVSGASRGIGWATARALAHEGVDVIMIARNPERLAAQATALRAETGVTVTEVAVDITTPEGQAAALAACPQADILITNADAPAPGDFREWAREDWIKAVDGLMLTPIALIRGTIDGMIARRFGRIVNISSRGVKIAAPELGLSNGARSGLVGFVAGLARQVAKHNVTINNVLPGPFDTDGQRAHIDGLMARTGKSFESIWGERRMGTPAERFGQADEVGAYCAFLCSAQAGFITAQNLLIDGGAYPGTY